MVASRFASFDQDRQPQHGVTDVFAAPATIGLALDLDVFTTGYDASRRRDARRPARRTPPERRKCPQHDRLPQFRAISSSLKQAVMSLQWDITRSGEQRQLVVRLCRTSLPLERFMRPERSRRAAPLRPTLAARTGLRPRPQGPCLPSCGRLGCRIRGRGGDVEDSMRSPSRAPMGACRLAVDLGTAMFRRRKQAQTRYGAPANQQLRVTGAKTRARQIDSGGARRVSERVGSVILSPHVWIAT